MVARVEMRSTATSRGVRRYTTTSGHLQKTVSNENKDSTTYAAKDRLLSAPEGS